jgi:hypothetical protein
MRKSPWRSAEAPQPWFVSESDTCPARCGGFLVHRRDGLPGRRCGFCATPETVATVQVRFPNGNEVRLGIGELRRMLRGTA